MNVRELVTTWGFDIDQSPLIQLGLNIASLKEVVELVHIGLEALAKPVEELYELAEGAAQARIELDKTSQTVGVAAGTLLGLQQAAKMSHIEVGTMDAGLRLLSRNALKAAQGGAQAAQAFALLGVSIHGQDGKLRSSDAILLDMADKFSKMPDGIQKTGLAMQVFGRSGAQLIPMLNKGREELGKFAAEGRAFAVQVPDYLKKSEEFGQAHVRVQSAWTNFKDTLGAEVMPTITGFMSELGNWYLDNKDSILRSVHEIMETINPILSVLGKVISLAIKAASYIMEVTGWVLHPFSSETDQAAYAPQAGGNSKVVNNNVAINTTVHQDARGTGGSSADALRQASNAAMASAARAMFLPAAAAVGPSK